jgi:hypothetical protein
LLVAVAHRWLPVQMSLEDDAGTRPAGYRRLVAGVIAVCLDQALYELVDVAGLGQAALVQQVAQLGLGQPS